MLQLLGVYVHNDQRLWTQLCRLVRQQIRYYQHQLDDPAAGNNAEAIRQLSAVHLAYQPKAIAPSFETCVYVGS